MMTVIISIVLVAAAVLLLSVRMIVLREHSIRSSHIEDSKPLRARGISCANKQMHELSERKNLADRIASEQP